MMEDNMLLQNYLKDKRYLECIQILRDKIIKYVVADIKKREPTFEFTTVNSLVSASSYYLYSNGIARTPRNSFVPRNRIRANRVFNIYLR